jgi:hypothetical protein
VHAVGRRHDGEGVEHPKLGRGGIEDESVLLVEAAPTADDFVRVAQLLGGRCATVLDEERVGPSTQLEVGLLHSGDAIPSPR